jgi:antitoxin HigA-1
MAIRLSKAFGSTPEMWLGLQMQYDLALAERNTSAMKVKKISNNQPQRTALSSFTCPGD